MAFPPSSNSSRTATGGPGYRVSGGYDAQPAAGFQLAVGNAPARVSWLPEVCQQQGDSLLDGACS